MAPNGLLGRVSNELGVTTLLSSSRDVHLLLLTRFVRMFAYGSSTLILALYFAALGHSDTKIGLFMTLTLVGDVGVSLALTFVADSLGRRRIMILGALLMTFSGVCFAIVSNYWILLLAAVVGVISPSGNEIGPFRAVEESTLAHLSDPRTRSDIFAWYVVFGTLGTAGGSLICGWVTQGLQTAGWTVVASFRFIFWVYALIGLAKAGVSYLLSPRCETQPGPTSTPDTAADGDEEEDEPFLEQNGAAPKPTTLPPPTKKSRFAIAQISPESRVTLLKLCGLFAFDSLGSGMVPTSLVAFYLSRKFGMPEGQLGSIIFAAQFISSIGNIFASSVAKRIGLVRAMVFTHLPSSIMLALLPLPSSLILTIILLVARSSLSSMDQAPRTAFLAAVVRPEERTAVMGVVNTVKTLSQSSGPLITGVLAAGAHFWVAFVAAGACKASYDVGMLSIFINTKLEGDRGGAGGGAVAARRERDAAEEFELADESESETELEEVEPRSVDR